jgi:hypothetical protein
MGIHIVWDSESKYKMKQVNPLHEGITKLSRNRLIVRSLVQTVSAGT